jgi:hypothetical protein
VSCRQGKRRLGPGALNLVLRISEHSLLIFSGEYKDTLSSVNVVTPKMRVHMHHPIFNFWWNDQGYTSYSKEHDDVFSWVIFPIVY